MKGVRREMATDREESSVWVMGENRSSSSALYVSSAVEQAEGDSSSSSRDIRRL